MAWGRDEVRDEVRLELSSNHFDRVGGRVVAAAASAKPSAAANLAESCDRHRRILRSHVGCKVAVRPERLGGLRSGTLGFSNGKTIVCGMVGAYLGVELVKWIYRIRIKTGDSFAVPMAVAVGIGRLSCFVAGCCYGTPTDLPWGVQFPNVDLLPRHPTQLYESLFHLVMAGVLAGLQHRNMLPGQLVKLYIMTYLVYRFGTEFIRPEPQMWVGLTAYQWFALAMLPCFAWLWWYTMLSAVWPTPTVMCLLGELLRSRKLVDTEPQDASRASPGWSFVRVPCLVNRSWKS